MRTKPQLASLSAAAGRGRGWRSKRGAAGFASIEERDLLRELDGTELEQRGSRIQGDLEELARKLQNSRVDRSARLRLSRLTLMKRRIQDELARREVVRDAEQSGTAPSGL